MRVGGVVVAAVGLCGVEWHAAFLLGAGVDGYAAAGNPGWFGALAAGGCRAAGLGGDARRRWKKGEYV